jgi:competence protein ComEC
MISATAALMMPVFGGAIAWLLYYPTLLLIWLVEFFTNLPGSSLAIGKIPLGVMLLIYLLMMLIWLNKWCQYRWWLISLFATTLVFIPIWYFHVTLVRVTVLAAKDEPVVVIQNKGKVTLINSGETDTARYTVLPFLARQGIDRIDRAVALTSNRNLDSGWHQIAEHLEIAKLSTNLDPKSIDLALNEKDIQPLTVDRKLSVGSTQISLVNAEPPCLQFTIEDRTWLLIDREFQNNLSNLKTEVLLWTGDNLNRDWLEKLKPQVAIASSKHAATKILDQIDRQHIQLYFTDRDGAIQWQPKAGFKKAVDEEPENSSI